MSELTAAEIAVRARAAGRLGIDTEFMSEGRYRPQLCLIQIAVPDVDNPELSTVALFDPMEKGSFDPAPISEVLEDPAVEVVMHAGRQDIAILRREWNCQITRFFDTQIAAGFVGYGAQTGYGALLQRVLSKSLEKSASFTRWNERPLSDEQLGYAREDVVDLLQLAERLQAELAERGRLEWALEECSALAQVNDERDPNEAYLRLPRLNRLKPQALAVARELAAWRERAAESRNCPVNAVVGDSSLIEIARRRPRNREELAEIRGIRGDLPRRHARDVFAAIERGAEADPPALKQEEHPRVDPVDVPLVGLCEALVRMRTSEAGLAYELVASRAALERLVATSRSGKGEAQVRTLAGWRRELVGAELLELLDGQIALAAKPPGSKPPLDVIQRD